MAHDVATIDSRNALTAMTEPELINVLQSSLYPGASPNSIKLVIGYCKAANLDPMQKPVHIVPMWDKNSKAMRDVIMPGVGLYRTQAARSDALAGISEPEFGPNVEIQLNGQKFSVPEWCRIVVKRQLTSGVVADFTAVEYWIENYATAGKDSELPNAMWKKRPRGQLAKCAEAQALRKAFPEMIGSAPTADEMEGKHIDAGEIDITPTSNPALAAKWVGKAEAAKDAAELERLWKEGVAEIKAADDMPAYAAFKGAVEGKGKAFKEQTTAQPAAGNDDFVKEMDAAAAEYVPE